MGYFKLAQTIGKKILTKDQKKWKKAFHKKKNLDWSDVKKSYKIFTKK